MPRRKTQKLLEAFEAYRLRKLLSARPGTVDKYVRAIGHCRSILQREPLVSDLSGELVAAVMARKRAQGRSLHTVNDARKVLVALWAWVARRKLVNEWPDIDRIKCGHASPVAWTREELAKLFHAADNMPGHVLGVPANLFWPALLLVLWDTGERIGAILKLSRSALNGDCLTVPAASRKGRTRDRLYRLHPETVAAVDKLRDFDPELLIAYRGHADTIFGRFSSVLRHAGLPVDAKHKFHCIRKSVASHGAALGADPSTLMDHASGDTTRRHYLDPRIAKRPKPVDLLFRPE